MYCWTHVTDLPNVGPYICVSCRCRAETSLVLPSEELVPLLRDPRDFTRLVSLLASRRQPAARWGSPGAVEVGMGIQSIE